MPELLAAAINGVDDVAAATFQWLDSFSSLVFILVLSAIYLLVRSIWRSMRKSVPAIKAALEFYEALFKLPAFMADTHQIVTEIRHEVFPNGGGSMRDDLATIDLRVQETTLQVKSIAKHDVKDHERLQLIEEALKLRVQRRSDALSDVTPYPADDSEADDG